MQFMYEVDGWRIYLIACANPKIVIGEKNGVRISAISYNVDRGIKRLFRKIKRLERE